MGHDSNAMGQAWQFKPGMQTDFKGPL
jgi:hypothetical protein